MNSFWDEDTKAALEESKVWENFITTEKMYKQGDIIIIRYPLSDQPTKNIIRPVVVISNNLSNSLDKDII